LLDTQDSSPFISLIPAVIEGNGNPAADGALEIFLPSEPRFSISSANHVTLAVSLIRERGPGRRLKILADS